MLKTALGQFAATPAWEENARTCIDLMARSAQAGAELLVLPEGVLARDITNPDIVRKSAQRLDGPFITQLCEASRGSRLTTLMSIHIPGPAERVWNTLIVIRNGEVLCSYRKLHLYDAFSTMESDNVAPGSDIPPLIECGGLKVGLMTCYDVRFPELARRLALDGAQVLVLPSAWVRGPLKEMHWDVLVTARALENTVYMVATGECGTRNIGCSMVVDPLGVAIARAAEAPALLFADLDPARVEHARTVLPVLENRRFGRPELRRPGAS
ncbi:MAG: deaminated glutathione amidase [Burkholderiaceae bacterium]